MIAVNDMENTDTQKILGAIGVLSAKVQVLVDDREYVHGAITDLTECIHGLADHMDDRFAQVDQKFERMDQRFVQVDQRFDQMDQRFIRIEEHLDHIDGRTGALEQRTSFIGSQMVTKDYLDKKLADFHGDTVLLIRRAISPST